MVLSCKDERERAERLETRYNFCLDEINKVQRVINEWDEIIESTGKAMFPAVLRSYKKMLLDFKGAMSARDRVIE